MLATKIAFFLCDRERRWVVGCRVAAFASKRSQSRQPSKHLGPHASTSDRLASSHRAAKSRVGIEESQFRPGANRVEKMADESSKGGASATLPMWRPHSGFWATSFYPRLFCNSQVDMGTNQLFKRVLNLFIFLSADIRSLLGQIPITKSDRQNNRKPSRLTIHITMVISLAWQLLAPGSPLKAKSRSLRRSGRNSGSVRAPCWNGRKGATRLLSGVSENIRRRTSMPPSSPTASPRQR